MLEGDEEGCVEGDEVEPELGAVETLGDADGEFGQMASLEAQ